MSASWRCALMMAVLVAVATITACRPEADAAQPGRTGTVASLPTLPLAPTASAEAAAPPASDGAANAPHGPCCPADGPPPGWLERPKLYENMTILSTETTDDGLVLEVEICSPNQYAMEGVMCVALEALEPLKEANGNMAHIEATFWVETDGVRQQSLGTAIWSKAPDVPNAELWSSGRRPPGYWYRAPEGA